MEIQLNGERRQVPDGLNLESLLQHLQIKSERVAIEHNRRIVKKEEWAMVKVQAGDELEIVHFVGGG
ncbi:MAG: sulfur carrier protein ThiS [Candidatus Acidiferrales bacterium]